MSCTVPSGYLGHCLHFLRILPSVCVTRYTFCRHLAGRDNEGSQIVVVNNCVTNELDEASALPSLRTRTWDNLLLYFLFLIDSLDETGSRNFVVLYLHKPG